MESIQGGLDSSGATGGVPPSQQDQDNYAQAVAEMIVEPKVGVSRSNVRGLANYDPQFAAALDITRGLDPTNNFGGTGGLVVPSYLRPQLTGDIASDPRGSFNLAPKYFSPVERFLQEDATNFIRSAQESAAGIPSLVSTGVGLIKNVFDGLSFLNDSKAGKTIEKVVEDEKRIEIAQLEKERLEQGLNKDFKTSTFPSIERTNVLDNSFMDGGNSLATNAEGISLLPTYLDQTEKNLISANRRANNISELLDKMKKETANVQIDAGANTGKKLNPELPIPFPYGRSGGYNLSVLSSTGDAAKPNPVQGPPSPFFPDQITPTKRPFATTDEVALRSSPDGYYFANAFNRPLDAARTSEKYRTPINEEEARAEEFNYKLSPIPKGTDPIQFINKRDLPSDLQGIVSLNTDLDYGPTTPLGYYFDQTARGKAEEKARLEKIRKEQDMLANIPRYDYSYSETEGLPLIY